MTRGKFVLLGRALHWPLFFGDDGHELGVRSGLARRLARLRDEDVRRHILETPRGSVLISVCEAGLGSSSGGAPPNDEPVHFTQPSS